MLSCCGDVKGQVGLLGKQIAYSLSPIIFDISAKILNKHCSYRLYDLEQTQVGLFLDYFWEKGGLGLNITTPYKRLVASLTSSSFKSVNTVYRSSSGWCSRSTDGDGFLLALTNSGIELSKLKNIVFIGNGGVVSSLLHELSCVMSCCHVFIFRRNRKYDQEVLSFSKKKFLIDLKILELSTLNSVLKDKEEDTLLIQATNAPEKGDDLLKFVPTLKDYKGFFFELAYSKRSALYVAAKNKKLLTLDGRSMLVAQALESQKYWWGKTVPFSLVYAEFNKKVSSLL